MSLLAVVLVLSLSGCGKEPTNQSTNNSNENQLPIDDSTSSEPQTETFEGDSIAGYVIGYEYCSESVIGYLLQLHYPDSIGNSLRYCEVNYTNVVKTYSEADHSLSVGEEFCGLYRILPDSLTIRCCFTDGYIFPVPELEIQYDQNVSLELKYKIPAKDN